MTMPSGIGEQVREFYNKTPFPDYELERFKTREDLRLAASDFARILDRSIPVDASVIDVGTGTGQLSAFLSLRRKEVWGVDFSDASLNKAKSLKRKLRLDTLRLEKIDILDREQVLSINRQFDYVLCLGVLHHTVQPYEGFKTLVELVKPGSYLAIGLYNSFGRIPHTIQKLLVRTIFRNNKDVKDAFLKMQTGGVTDKKRRHGWWNDQYFHPHESTHTIGEVIGWFKRSGIEYYQILPPPVFSGGDTLEMRGVWNKEAIPNLLIRLLTQILWVWKTQHEGGYWIIFGRKNAPAKSSWQLYKLKSGTPRHVLGDKT